MRARHPDQPPSWSQKHPCKSTAPRMNRPRAPQDGEARSPRLGEARTFGSDHKKPSRVASLEGFSRSLGVARLGAVKSWVAESVCEAQIRQTSGRLPVFPSSGEPALRRRFRLREHQETGIAGPAALCASHSDWRGVFRDWVLTKALSVCGCGETGRRAVYGRFPEKGVRVRVPPSAPRLAQWKSTRPITWTLQVRLLCRQPVCKTGYRCCWRGANVASACRTGATSMDFGPAARNGALQRADTVGAKTPGPLPDGFASRAGSRSAWRANGEVGPG